METYTTDDALTVMGFGKFQALVLAYAGMGWVAEAMEVMLLSFLGPVVREEWNVSPQDESILSSVVFAGMLIGAFTWGFISDRYGRRTVLLLSTLLTCGLGFLSALSPNYFCLLALRFFVGIGVGSGHVFSSWFLEFVPAGNRGTWMVIFSFFWTIGTVLEASLAWVVLSALSWRWLLALSSLPCFLLLPFFRITPESPRYLCAQNRMIDARLILERMANANQAALPLGVLTYHGETKNDYITNTSEDEHLIPVREKEYTPVNAVSSKSGAIAALHKLVSHNLLRSTLLLWFVYYASSFAYYGIALLTSQLSDVNKSCSSDLISEMHQKDGNLYKDTFITSLAEIPGLILSALLVDWFGRKATMCCLMFACCAFLGPLVLHQNEMLTTMVLFGARACGTGGTTVLCLYAPEVYPTSVRSTGVGIATAIGKIGGVVCPLVAVGMLRSCHQMAAVLVFELVLFLAGVACILFPVETKGREMD
ncbi:organic cation/carnitine transporter 7-like isoform X2 [Panicum virgatum]|uniref:Major facilitator superfamily (MFS) profile domain-containing protein n=3 Tax=Panicum virgatum TaxID=38727 RepID=A0A8T0MH67_PANVG|nr:organic cation/carnitine transporter 7-like isoform X2 [Panicum virgatum]XP_039828843.1 organic cation/carnitine transporter 7-like isoform X2 [Panicum virgatum]XP_039828844.1 organic cation/carnitine transporter 7-like isoform X2 [Panicum virgatum]XP_039828845.1 organic cation/carnitine transporter 7-like isoform X2 [Panicum virgatum]XP_039828846.1 organic cation/carnitine transporter 7-like isoform X2 [Panicum virgatum]XP_039828847.1 organic cation/carnitine transporter 7-like isoform X2 